MLSTKVLAQAANKNTKFMFPKTDDCFFLKYGFRSHCPKNSKQTLPRSLSTRYRILDSYFESSS